jgi:hypothetical protein
MCVAKWIIGFILLISVLLSASVVHAN